MRRIMQRRLAILCTAIASVALAGCGVGPSNGSANGGNALTVWFPGTDTAEINLLTKQIVPRFEQATGSRVQITFVDWSALSPKLSAAFAAGTAPDVFGHGPAAAAEFVADDRIEQLTEQVESLGKKSLRDLSAALPGGQVNGVQYFIPLSMVGEMIVYRAADLRAAGVDPDAPPTTWEGVLDAARKMTQRTGDRVTKAGLLLPTDPLGLQQSFASLLESAGGELLTPDGKSAAFDSPAGIKALDYLVDVYQGPDPVGADLGADYLDAPIAQQPVVLGTAAMEMQTVAHIQQMVTDNPGLDLRVMQPPKFVGTARGAAIGGPGPGLMINKDSTKKALAWKFISYLISPDINLEYNEGTGGGPVRSSAASSDYVRDSPVVRQFARAAADFQPDPNVPTWVHARDTLSKYLDQGVNQVVEVPTALRQAATEVDGILASSG
jgi:multiple sugar transport system substrate-binding protein